jgi:hypothetical protein
MSGMSGMTGMSGMSGMMGGEEVAELMIPANKVGLIIGKGGEMIKALQVYTHCYKTEQQCHLAFLHSLTHTPIRSPLFIVFFIRP